MAEDLKAQLKAEWDAGDYSYTGPRLEPASIELVERLGIAAGERVLDVAAGTGNFALAAASHGAVVDALDFSSVMITKGSKRTQGLEVSWHEGDAEDLPFPSSTFDVAASVFGVMFAPNHAKAAAELARVVKPGGRIAVNAWTPSGNVGTFVKTLRGPIMNLPPDTPDPLRWGTEEGVSDLLGPHAASITSSKRWVTFSYASWDEYMAALESNGSARMAKEKLPSEAYQRSLATIREVVEGFNQATDGSVVYDGEYLETIAVKH